MAYAVYADVQRYLAQWTELDGSSQVTSSDVTEFITDTEALINSRLSKCGYTVPATGTDDIALLRGIVSQVVAIKVYSIAFGDEELPGVIAGLQIELASVMEEIRTCQLVLTNQLDGSATTIGTANLKVLDFDE